MELTRCDFFKTLDVKKDNKVVVLNDKRKKRKVIRSLHIKYLTPQ